jgi:hypothetical protein
LNWALRETFRSSIRDLLQKLLLRGLELGGNADCAAQEACESYKPKPFYA